MNKRFRKGAIATAMTAVMGLSGCTVSTPANPADTSKPVSVVSVEESYSESSYEQSVFESSQQSSEVSDESSIEPESVQESSQESSRQTTESEYDPSKEEVYGIYGPMSAEESSQQSEESVYDPSVEESIIYGIYGPMPVSEEPDDSTEFDMSNYIGEFRGDSNDYNGSGYIKIVELSDGRYSIESSIVYNGGKRISEMNYTTEITSDTITFTAKNSFLATYSYTMIFKDGYIDFSSELISYPENPFWVAPNENHMIFTK